jgi:hypothetical protein
MVGVPLDHARAALTAPQNDVEMKFRRMQDLNVSRGAIKHNAPEP